MYKCFLQGRVLTSLFRLNGEPLSRLLRTMPRRFTSRAGNSWLLTAMPFSLCQVHGAPKNRASKKGRPFLTILQKYSYLLSLDRKVKKYIDISTLKWDWKWSNSRLLIPKFIPNPLPTHHRHIPEPKKMITPKHLIVTSSFLVWFI